MFSKEKIIIILSTICLLNIIVSGVLFFHCIHYRNLNKAYITELNSVKEYRDNLQSQYNGLKQDYDILEHFSKHKPENNTKQNIDRNIKYGTVPIPPKTIYKTEEIYTYPKTERIQTVYNNTPTYSDNEIQERRLMELESKVNQYELERDIWLLGR